MTDISDDFDTTARLTVGTPFTGLFELVDGAPANDTDKIGVELTAGTDYVIGLDGPVGPRLILQVTQPNTFIPGNTIGAGGRAELDFTPDTDGLYFIDVSGRAAATDGYTLTVEVAPANVIVDIDDGAGRGLFGTDGNDRIEGLGGDDTIDAGAGADTVLGGTGDDAILGGDGNDSLDGGPGTDVMQGGAGDDVYVVDDAGDVVVEDAGDAGVDTIFTATRFALGEGQENVVATGTADVRLDGNRGDNEITGNDGDNILVGFGGSDTMTGGAGADTFALVRGGAPDLTVTDFSDGDRLAVDDQLVGLGARGISPRDLTVDDFRTLLQAGTVGYAARTGELKIDLDGDGSLETVADLGAGTRLTLDDVLLF